MTEQNPEEGQTHWISSRSKWKIGFDSLTFSTQRSFFKICLFVLTREILSYATYALHRSDCTSNTFMMQSADAVRNESLLNKSSLCPPWASWFGLHILTWESPINRTNQKLWETFHSGARFCMATVPGVLVQTEIKLYVFAPKRCCANRAWERGPAPSHCIS